MRLTRPDPAAIAWGACGAIWTAAFLCEGWKIPAAIAAGCTAAAVILAWRVPGEDPVDALAAAVTCRMCRPAPYGPCSCGRDCGDLRCARAPKDVVSR